MSKVSCPYCGSVQVKAMANQPKKYPRPSDPVALVDWQKGYDCKKCGNDFVVAPPKPKKPVGFFTKLMGWMLLVVIAFMAYMIIANPAKDNKTDTANEPDSIEQVIKETESQDSDLKYNEDDPTPVAIEPTVNQEFTKEAEEAAHAYIPPVEEPQKSIADSKDQGDTLSIKTTLREKE
ncbi:MAG: hypothetical protein RR605_04210 [Acinetobacter sp.]